MCKLKLVLLISGALSLAGCASVPNVPLQKNFWQDHKQKIEVSTDKPKKAMLFQTGGEGLLDYAINNMVTDKFQTYLETYPMQSVTNIRWDFLKKLKMRNMNANVYNYPIDVSKLTDYSGDKKKFAVKNYTPLVAKIGKHKLLLVSVNAIGAEREYYGFIPLGAPKATCCLTGRLVDVRNNKILWRHFADVTLKVSGSWDQPPKYPNFTKTLNRAVATAKQELLNDFFTAQASHLHKIQQKNS